MLAIPFEHSYLGPRPMRSLYRGAKRDSWHKNWDKMGRGFPQKSSCGRMAGAGRTSDRLYGHFRLLQGKAGVLRANLRILHVGSDSRLTGQSSEASDLGSNNLPGETQSVSAKSWPRLSRAVRLPSTSLARRQIAAETSCVGRPTVLSLSECSDTGNSPVARRTPGRI